jgi:hypothetical protein
VQAVDDAGNKGTPVTVNAPGSGGGGGNGGGGAGAVGGNQSGGKTLRLEIKRKRNPNHRRTCFKVKVSTSDGVVIPGATVNFAGKNRATKANGVARICKRTLPRGRKASLTVTANGYSPLSQPVRIRKRR